MKSAGLRRVGRAFDERQAYGVESARTLSELGIHESFGFRRLVDRGVVIVVTGGKYYLDRARWDEFRQTRKRRAMFAILFFIVALPALIWFLRTE